MKALQQQYPIFKRNVNGILKQTSEYDCEWVFHKNSYAIGNQFREYTDNDIDETIPYDKEKGLYHLQPVWTKFYDIFKVGVWVDFFGIGTKYDMSLIESIEPITPEQLKVMPFIWEMYSQRLRDTQ